MNSNYVIFLTGCVNPKGMVYTAINDPNVRIQQYIKSIRYYLENTTLPVVFCENTLARITTELTDIPSINERFEYITFDGNNFDKSLGKGYGECEIIDYALQHSRLIADHPYIVKITGRIIVLDIMEQVTAHTNLPQNTIRTLLPTEDRFVDSRMIICNKLFFKKYFIPFQQKLNDQSNYYFEHLLYDTIASQQEFLFIPFISFPNYRGYSGSAGYQYKEYGEIDKLYYRDAATKYYKHPSSPSCARKIPTKVRCKLATQHMLAVTQRWILIILSKIEIKA